MKKRAGKTNGGGQKNGTGRLPKAAVDPQAVEESTPAKARKANGGWTLVLPVLVVAVSYAMLLGLLLPHRRQAQVPATVGQPSPVKVVAPRSFSIVDQEKTRLARERAAEAVTPPFEKVGGDVDRALERIDSIFSAAQSTAQAEGLDPEQRRGRLADAIGLAQEEHEQLLELLLEYPRYNLLQDKIKENLKKVLSDGVVASPEGLVVIQRHLNEGIDVFDAQGTMTRRLQVASIRDETTAQQHFARLIAAQFNKQIEDERPRKLAENLGNLLIEPTLRLDREKFENRKKEAATAVEPVQAVIQRNQKLIDEGEVVPAELEIPTREGGRVAVGIGTLLEKLQEAKEQTPWNRLIAQSGLILIPLLLLAVYVKRYHQEVWKNPINLSCLFGVQVIIVAIGRLLEYLSVALGSPLDTVGYALPVALSGLLVTILLDTHLALFSVLTLATIGGLIFDSFDFFLVYLVGGLVSVFSVSSVRRRMDISWVGLKVSLATCAMATLVYLLSQESINDLLLDPHSFGMVMIWAFLSGILTIMLAGFLLPLMEHLMGVITDFQLLELSQKSEVLKRLEIDAPGTYQHSINVAHLAESAAEAIEANGLMARVMALYHDIGKLKKPTYFSENQVKETDRKSHDKLSPSMSRLIIYNHVKDGADIADKANLPGFIRDAIVQHHGTTLLTYFYDKALRGDSKDVVSESDYRYPGPKPQSVEMAILMLADSLEAASRSLPVGMASGELYQFVQRIINEKFVDGQFEHCDLSMSDLHLLSQAFTRSLVSLLHRRVAYPQIETQARQKKTTQSTERQEEGKEFEPEKEPVRVETTMTAPGRADS